MLTREFYQHRTREDIMRKLRHHIFGEDRMDDTFYDVVIVKAFDRLPLRSKKILRYHLLQLNKIKKKDWTGETVGALFGITRSRVMQIESISLRTIRATVRDCKYYYDLGCKNTKENLL